MIAYKTSQEKLQEANKLCKLTLNAGLLLWYIPLSLHFTTKASLRWGQLHRALGVCDAKAQSQALSDYFLLVQSIKRKRKNILS